ncbi:MAG TPA: cyclic lactone autoinducer peptide [Syntrophaceticus sp.]|nr:cyclic lactone autoinducer peptide [Syntrophaceticus sp.]
MLVYRQNFETKRCSLIIIVITGVGVTCWFNWYQPKLLEKGKEGKII